MSVIPSPFMSASLMGLPRTRASSAAGVAHAFGIARLCRLRPLDLPLIRARAHRSHCEVWISQIEELRRALREM
jgi:hypothetical protein